MPKKIRSLPEEVNRLCLRFMRESCGARPVPKSSEKEIAALNYIRDSCMKAFDQLERDLLTARERKIIEKTKILLQVGDHVMVLNAKTNGEVFDEGIATLKKQLGPTRWKVVFDEGLSQTCIRCVFPEDLRS